MNCSYWLEQPLVHNDMTQCHTTNQMSPTIFENTVSMKIASLTIFEESCASVCNKQTQTS